MLKQPKENSWNKRKNIRTGEKEDINNGSFHLNGQRMYWFNEKPTGFWYAELWLQPKELWGTPLKEIKKINFTSVDILKWINNHWIEGKEQHSTKIQVPKDYGLRIQAYYNHYSMVFNWKHKVKLSKRLTSDCIFYDSNNIKRVIAAKDMFIITIYEKSKKNKCIDDCRLKNLPVNSILIGDM